MGHEMRSILSGLILVLAVAVFAGGNNDTANTTSSANTNAQLLATSKAFKGFLEQITITCPAGVTGGTVTCTSVPVDTNNPSYTLITTNSLTGNAALYPRTSQGDRYFLWNETVQTAVTNVTDSNVVFRSSVKTSR